MRIPKPGLWFPGRSRFEGSGLEGFEGLQDWEEFEGPWAGQSLRGSQDRAFGGPWVRGWLEGPWTWGL